MLLLDGQMKEAHLELVFGQLQEKVAWLTERPYLPKGIADRTLALLKILMEVRLACRQAFVLHTSPHTDLICINRL